MSAILRCPSCSATLTLTAETTTTHRTIRADQDPDWLADPVDHRQDRGDAMPATPAKLRDDSWGARVRGVVDVGDAVRVETKSGRRWRERVTEVVCRGSDDDGSAVTLARTERIERGGR